MRCAIYIRVSTDKVEQKASLINQRELFIKYIAEKGWDIYDFYVDVESGTTDKREKLQQLIEDAKCKKFDIILAKELSRLARNGELSYQIKSIAENNKIHILTLDNAINTLNGNSNMFGIYAWMYEQESQRISERVKYSLNNRAEKGLFKGSIPPYGYTVENGKLHIRLDDTTNVVKRIYKDYIAGKGFDRIAMNLYEEGIPTPSQIAGKANAGDKWHGSSVRLILENPHYMGDLVQGRTTTISVTCKSRNKKNPDDYIIVENTHDGIISKEDFHTVQQLIKSRKKIRPQAQVHLFTNLLFCADCGHGMHFKKNRKGYICGNYNKHGKTACTDHIVREKELADAILTDLKYLISNLKDEKFITNLENMIKKQKKKIEKDLKAYIKEIETLKSNKSKVISLLINETITKEDYDTYVSDLNKKITKLEMLKYEHESVINQNFNSSSVEELKNLKDDILDLKELTPEVLNRFIERIEIKSDGTPKIYYRFSESSVYFSDFFSNTQHSTWLDMIASTSNANSRLWKHIH